MDKKNLKEKIILGLDPGTTVMGYGVLRAHGQKMTLMQFGVIKLARMDSHALRLKKIFERILSLVDEYHPDEVALEAPFFGKNVQSMLKLGRAQGVAMAAALYRQIPITEYAPRKIKQAVTGNGNSSKEQVAAMLSAMFSLKEAPQFLDATDALAVAVCHHYQGKAITTLGGNDWKSFLKKNPGRIKK